MSMDYEAIIKEVVNDRKFKLKNISNMKFDPIMKLMRELPNKKDLFVIYEGSEGDDAITFNLIMNIDFKKDYKRIKSLRPFYKNYIVFLYKHSGFWLKKKDITKFILNSFLDECQKENNEMVKCDICTEIIDSTNKQIFTCKKCYKSLCYECAVKHYNILNNTTCPFCRNTLFKIN